MQHIYRNKYSVVIIDTIVYVYKYENCKFDQPFPTFQPKHIFIGQSKVCETTEFSGAADNSFDFDDNTLLLQCENNEYVNFSGLEILKSKTDDRTIDYISFMGNNMVPYTFAIGKKIHISYTIVTNLLKVIILRKELC